jgi:hypothetical protein
MNRAHGGVQRIAAALCAFVSLLGLACSSPSSSREAAEAGRALPTRDEIATRIAGRMREAAAGVEQARSSAALPPLERLDARQRVLKDWLQAPPSARAAAETPDALKRRVRVAGDRLAVLGLACEEQALRGSSAFYRASAELWWEHTHAQELARRLGLSADAVPDNVYQLVDAESATHFRLVARRQADARGPAGDRPARCVWSCDRTGCGAGAVPRRCASTGASGPCGTIPRCIRQRLRPGCTLGCR